MGIKIAHAHDGGKKCYITTGRQALTQRGIFQIKEGVVFGVAYMPYTGQWYAYDLETGKEIGSFSRQFFEQAIAQFQLSPLIPDPDCVVV